MSNKFGNSYIKCLDFVVSKEEFDLIQNEQYGFLCTHPKPSREQLPSYYESPEYISHTDRKKGLIESIYQLIKRITLQQKLRLINRIVPKKGILLDIGAGTGDFLKTVKKSGWSIDGIEPNSKARNNASNKNIHLRSNYESLIDNKFDVITMWHVLEHVYDLDKQVAIIDSLLKKSGVVVIAVPNYKSYDAIYYKKYWAAYDAPRHLWHFSKESVSLFFKEKGFYVEQVKPMIFDAFYVSLLSEKYKKGTVNFFNAFRIGLYSNLKAKFSTKEYSSLIYIIKRKLN